MKKYVRLIFVLLLTVFLITSCDMGGGNNSTSSNDTGEMESTGPTEYAFEKPVLILTGNVVSWKTIESNIIKYQVSINDKVFILTKNVSSYTVEENDIVKMRIIDYEGNPMSEWSDPIIVEKVEPEYQYVTVTFKSKEGLFEDFTQEVIVNSGNYLPTPEVQGYKFIGWHYEEEYNEDVKLYGYVPNDLVEDATMYARFTPNSYKLNYNDFSSWVEFYSEDKRVGISSVGGNTPELGYPTQPTKDGYIFTGWYTDSECKNFFNPNTYLTRDLNLYAGWFPESKLMYNSRFNDDKYDWALDNFLHSDLKTTVKVYDGASVICPIRLSFTVWEEKTYELKYRIKEFNSGCRLLLVDENKQKFIADRYPDFSTTAESIEFEGIPGNVYTVYLYNADNNPSIELSIPGSCPETLPRTPNSCLLVYNENFTLPTFEKDNLEFYGYFTEKDGKGTQITDQDGKSLAPFSFTEETRIYPHYGEITYKINYQNNGGELAEGQAYVSSFKANELPITLPTLTKTGSVFDGWYDNENFEGDAITKIDTIEEQNINLYAKFTKIDYKIKTYFGAIANESSLIDEKTINYSDTYNLTNEIPDGYKINNYYYLDNNVMVNIEQSGKYLFEQDLDVFISYSAIEYSITYNTNGGSVSNDIVMKDKYLVTDSFDLPQLVKDNFVFDGWYETEDFSSSKVEKISVGTTGNKVLYAKFSVRQYKISVYFGNQNSNPELIEEVSLYNGDEYKLNKKIVNGYEISGYYYLSDDGFEMFVTDTGVYEYTNDLILYTLYDPIQYNITYHMNGGSLNESSILVEKYNITNYVQLPELTKDGYVFEGWFNNALFSGESISYIDYGQTGDIELYAKFAQYKYIISVDNSKYGLDNIEKEVIYGLDYELPYTVVEGATFMGYYLSPNDQNMQICNNEGKSNYAYDWMMNLTLYPYYDATQYNISYNYPGGGLSSSLVYSYTVFDQVIELPVVYYMDYKFLGWYTDSEFTSEIVTHIDPKSMENYTLYARCEDVYYNCSIAYENIEVVFDLQYDNKKIVQVIDYASENYKFRYPENPQREGYIFGGWYKTPECGDNDTIYLGVFPIDNLTLYAKWIQIPEAIINGTNEIIIVDYNDCKSTDPFTYKIKETATEETPTLFFILTDPNGPYAEVNIKGSDKWAMTKVGLLDYQQEFYQSEVAGLSTEFKYFLISCMKYSILMIYVYGDGYEFDVSLSVGLMYEYPPINICNKYIKHSARLQVFKNIGDKVLQGIYTEPNGQGQLLSSDWEVLSQYLYEGLVVYPYYVLKE